MFVGAGTALNVATILAGTATGVLLGHRLPQRTRDVVTDGLGLVTLLIAGVSAAAVVDPDLTAAVGDSAPMLIVLGALLVGGVCGSLLRIEDRLEQFGGALQRRLARTSPTITRTAGAGDPPAAAVDPRERFVEGFVTASLVFCIGPLTILGALSDGLGEGIDQLALKSVLDGFAAIAFAASLGWGVGASAIAVLVVQGLFTVLGLLLGGFVPDAHLTALTATGGLLLVGVAIRLLRLRSLPVGDLLPALVVAPLLTEVVLRLQ